MISSPLFAVRYLSRAVAPIAPRDLAEILFASRRYNAEREVTGRLLVQTDTDDKPDGQNGGPLAVRFLQWLEGPEPAVRDVFARVSADPRHEIVDVDEGPVERRRYPAWDMEAAEVASADAFDRAAAETDGP